MGGGGGHLIIEHKVKCALYNKSFIYPTECTTRLKFTSKFYIKILLHVSVNKPSSGSLLLCFAKVMFIKIVS